MTDQTETLADDNDGDLFTVLELKSICARLNIPVETVTLPDGTTDLLMDRAGMERIRDSMLLVGELDLAQLWQEITEKRWPPS
ncbi:hypothetical protein [Streptomyces sp. MBT55]|uniref:hypothetical protein n=1 Tax=Streptomyces sp. MBT55 TaxID=1488386 RepID=UPI001913891C|nr:hypothetical protein [Streptomyces sp. MBT55]MBK6040832.1 hypothetical protein [Streptomyces sp. MBT55]